MEGKNEKVRIVQVCRILQDEGLLDGFGHVTWRVGENEILSTPKMPPGYVTVEDIIHLDLSGKRLRGDKPPNAETPLHLAIYQMRSDVSCIIHYHPPAVIALSVVGKEVLPVCNEGAYFCEGTPIYDDPCLLTTMEQGYDVARVLENKNTVLLRGHGAIVVGESMERVCRLAVGLEKTAHIQILAESTGTPRVHSLDDAKALKAIEESEGALRRFWAFYEMKLGFKDSGSK
jgi:ribulose-5-phosphate 4-epimerase/fuculose-1-phosphate aldolase